MVSKKAVSGSAPAQAPAPVLRWIKKVLWFPLGWMCAFGAFLVCSLLAWPVIIGLQRVTDYCLIHHPAGTWISMNAMAESGLLDYPTDYMAFATFVINFPVGFIALFWYMFLFTITNNVREAWPKLPKRDRALRKERQRALLTGWARNAANGTVFFFLLCVPFIRQYEILTDRAILVKGFFDWNEEVYPLDQLKSIRRTVTGKGLISWDFNFSDGRYFTTTGPSRRALDILLRRPNVSSNVRLVNGQLEKMPER